MEFLVKIIRITIATALIVAPSAYQAAAAGPKVSQYSVTGNKHNLSAKAWDGAAIKGNTSAYRSTDDEAGNPKGQQICIFCHTPHNANVVGQAPLWNRKFSSEVFQRYSTDTLQIRKISEAQYAVGAQPNGSSKLCLSCHDGVSRLGEVNNGGEITMMSGYEVITGIASFKSDTNKMKTGHHPVSFVYNDAVRNAIQASKLPATVFTFPPTLTEVKLDKESRMQCTTCHDPHQNQSDDNACYLSPTGSCDATYTRKIAPFWVYNINAASTAAQDQQAVCTSCHPMTLLSPAFTPPWP
ncbi:MAG: cytochrome C [Desulfuromonadaceae bacterium]|nr:cytochrome C [Desulfuromonadaceae bacterium]MDD2854505.1 cytochrome C [Desulfuromonadaceae bacterium]